MTVTIRHGDCREILRTMPDESVHCVVTSPPYYGLRDYGVAGQIGLEKRPNAFVAELTLVFREVRRVLKKDGTLWLNLGDSYVSNGRYDAAYEEKKQRGGMHQNDAFKYAKFDPRVAARDIGVKTKNLLGIPWRVAFSLQADGWCLRQDIVWSKPNPMPESVRDRCTKSHEYLFLLSRDPNYYFDQEAILEPIAPTSISRLSQDVAAQAGSDRVPGKINGRMKAVSRPEMTRNKRSVWEVTTQPFSEAHFATFPPDLVEPCIKAGCPVGGVVLDPFGGAGTTGLVADRLGRDAILIELNPEYAAMAERRIRGDAGMFAETIRI